MAGEFGSSIQPEESTSTMLWLVLGIVLLVIAIAGGAIVHPIFFVLGILALVVFVSGYRGRGAAL
jgi:membrane protein implicated in regulation of membrane protease activity